MRIEPLVKKLENSDLDTRLVVIRREILNYFDCVVRPASLVTPALDNLAKCPAPQRFHHLVLVPTRGRGEYVAHVNN